MRFFYLLILVTFLVSCGDSEQEVNIYSSQSEHLIRPIVQKFEEKTGIKVNITTGGKSELVAKLEFEKQNTPADLLLTSDIANIYKAKEKGLLQPIDSDILNSSIASNLRDKEGYWYALTKRIRAIFYNKKRISHNVVESYYDLKNTELIRGILIRSSSNVYNQSLTASIIAKYGEDKAYEWAKGVVRNLARSPQGGDTDQLKALAVGEGSIAVANSYYYGRLTGDDASLYNEDVAKNVGIIFPVREKGGAHINIRGGGITKYAKNKKNAVKLLEYLVSPEAQKYFAEVNLEYPVIDNIEIPAILQKWGKVEDDDVSLEEIGKLHDKAIEIMDKAGWK